jgi:hypothetical protein
VSGVHSPVAPSAAGRWVVCEGSVELVADIVEDDGPEAMEGEAAHHVSSTLLTTGALMPLDSMAPNGIFVTEEMREVALLYAEHVAARVDPVVWHERLHVEKRIVIPRVHQQCYGTPDGWALVGNVLHIWDLKFGHLFVEVFECWQLICYYAGILDLIERAVSDEQLEVHFRDGPIRTWVVRGSDLRAHINRLANAAARALNGGALCKTSDECDLCPGRHRCEALRKDAYRSVAIAGSAQAHALSPYQAGVELHRLHTAKRALDALISGLETQAEHDLRRGAFVPHWQLESEPGRLKWAASNDELRGLEMLYDVKLFKEPEPITPTQAGKLSKGLEATLRSYAKRDNGGLKLKPFDINQARKVYSNGKG